MLTHVLKWWSRTCFLDQGYSGKPYLAVLSQELSQGLGQPIAQFGTEEYYRFLLAPIGLEIQDNGYCISLHPFISDPA